MIFPVLGGLAASVVAASDPKRDVAPGIAWVTASHLAEALLQG